MTTNIDIVNRALQLVGTRTTVASLGEQSNEAIQANLIYNTIVDWCHAASNWNFARKTAALVVAKQITPPVSAWVPATQPTPPWLYEYSLPADFIRAIYLTNAAHTTTAKFDGEPKRFAVTMNNAGTAEVLITNEAGAILIYTGRVVDPTLWPPYFERFAVSTLAANLVYQLNGSPQWVKELQTIFMSNFQMAEQINREEGLVFADTTPEWIIALGIDYPFRRGYQHNQMLQSKREKQSDDNS